MNMTYTFITVEIGKIENLTDLIVIDVKASPSIAYIRLSTHNTQTTLIFDNIDELKRFVESLKNAIEKPEMETLP
jgi:pyruvate-formate lyase-activating enzyme